MSLHCGLSSAATLLLPALVQIAQGKKGLLWLSLRVWLVMVDGSMGSHSGRQAYEASTGSRDEGCRSAHCVLIWSRTLAHAMGPPMSGWVFLP